MIKGILFILISLISTSCGSKNLTNNSSQEKKHESIKNVIKKCGFLKLPLAFDANIANSLNVNYSVDLKSNDSLFLDQNVDGIIGFLPDTTKNYAFLFYTVGDMLYPTIMTMDKNGKEIDRKIICVSGCAGHAELNVTSCYDSVYLSNDLTIRSISKVVGIIDTDDSIPKILTICNLRMLSGYIDIDGKIKLNESSLIDCN